MLLGITFSNLSTEQKNLKAKKKPRLPSAGARALGKDLTP